MLPRDRTIGWYLAIADAELDRSTAAGPPSPQPTPEARDLQRTFRLLLATIWLLDAVLQLQPFMFTPGSSGFSGMLNGPSRGNPGWVAHTITWNGSIVYHQPILTDAVFASVQFLIAFGIVWKRTTKYALGLSIVWALAVWWFGEGAGGIFQGTATPLGGGPGMFVPSWAFGPDAMWELIFAALMVWFIANSVLSVQLFGLHVPHALVHAVMSFTMILMYWFPAGTTRGSGAMSMTGTPSGAHLDGGLGLLLEFVLLGSAIFTLASPNRGASHHGSHVPAHAMSASSGSGAPASPHRGEGRGSAGAMEARVTIPWLEDLSHVVMCIAMAFMLILMV